MRHRAWVIVWGLFLGWDVYRAVRSGYGTYFCLAGLALALLLWSIREAE
jgi:hypothetical protein